MTIVHVVLGAEPAGLACPSVLFTGPYEVSTSGAFAGAVARALFCTAAGAEAGHVNTSANTTFRSTTSRLCV